MTTKARALLEHGLKDMYDAEQRFVKALGTMTENARDRTLADGFRRHRAVTQEQVKRLERVFAELGTRPAREECPAAKGLVREYEKFAEEEGAVDGLLDAFAATAGLKVEHYEIASYRALIDLAEFCDLDGAARLLKQNLAEEEEAAAEMQSASMKLSAELAGVSTTGLAQRSLGAMVDQVREGTFAAVGGMLTVGERALGEAQKVVRKAERRGRARLDRKRTSAASGTKKARAASPSVKTRGTKKAATARSRGTSKGTRGTRNVSRPRAKATASRKPASTARRTSTARKASRPASGRAASRRTSTRRASR